MGGFYCILGQYVPRVFPLMKRGFGLQKRGFFPLFGGLVFLTFEMLLINKKLNHENNRTKSDFKHQRHLFGVFNLNISPYYTSFKYLFGFFDVIASSNQPKMQSPGFPRAL